MTVFSEMNCSLARTLGLIGERWSLLVIREAFMGSTRFDEFHTRLGVARNILTARLATLVEAGILQRVPSEHSARIFDYTLTEKGQDLFTALCALQQWGDKWLSGSQGAPVVLVEKATNQPVRRLALRGKTKELAGQDVIFAPGPGATPRTRQRLKLMKR